MCGSGIVLQEALSHGHKATGFDIDPLAVLISRVSTRSLDTAQLTEIGNAVANQAALLDGEVLDLPWID